MEKKRGRKPKVQMKRGKPRKIKVQEEVEEVEEFENSSGDDGAGAENYMIHQTGHYVPVFSQGTVSAGLDAPTCSRYPTRYSKALADQHAKLGTPFGSSVQNAGPSETLKLVREIVLGENQLGPGINNPVEEFTSENPVPAKDLHKQNDENNGLDIVVHCSETEYQSIPSKNVLDLKKFASDLLAQTQGQEVMFDNHLSTGEDNVAFEAFAQGLGVTLHSQADKKPTRSSSRLQMQTVSLIYDKPFDNNDVGVQGDCEYVQYNGYNVKREMVPLLKAIFSKYGDIAKDSSFSIESRSCLLELVYTIYKRLEVSELTQLTPLELESITGQIGDLELVKVEVGWLQERVDQISEARQLCNGVSTLKDAEARIMLKIDEKKRAVKTYEKELEICMATNGGVATKTRARKG